MRLIPLNSCTICRFAWLIRGDPTQVLAVQPQRVHNTLQGRCAYAAILLEITHMSVANKTGTRLFRKCLLLCGLLMACTSQTQAFDDCHRELENQCDGGTPAYMCVCSETACSW